GPLPVPTPARAKRVAEAARTTVISMLDRLLDHSRLAHQLFTVRSHQVVARLSEPVPGPVDG
ncbi:MAG: hypothetical protein NZ600_07450, partial [Acidimicrobiales bacterium]|nr:hypothetical protein [Acidimicrobiales bacterium]